jgi:Na+-transporting NADH:ubiquinone oxidoreductase subunit A
MGKTIKISKGLDIKLKGTANEELVNAEFSKTYAIKPTDFEGLTPKILIKPGAEVKSGTILFFDKYNPKIQFSSPVSGKITSIDRGELRKVLQITIEADNETKYEEFKKFDLKSLKREEVIEQLLNSGTWPFIRQRPYAIIANPETTPKSIFISGFDNAPLAPNYDFIIKNDLKNFQNGITVLSKLTDGKIYLNINNQTESTYSSITGVEKNIFIGKHPSSTIGTQINHISPINKGEFVWYVNPQDVIIVGKLFSEGKFDASKIIAITGSQIEKPKYLKTVIGAELKSLLNSNNVKSNSRYISGNVLTGTKINKTSHIGFYHSQITIIPEGNYYEFIGWAMPRLNKYSASKTFFSWLTPNKEYILDTNTNGGQRAFVMSEEYNKVVPINILPVELLKACIAEDIDKMEQLGIYEVAEEDLALCEFICTSKIDVQEIIRKGINLMIKELG